MNIQRSGSLSKLIRTLEEAGFDGDVQVDKATRLVGATDNSIYRIEPAAIVFPKSADALRQLVASAHRLKVPLTARGGGTGTNGQSLTEYVVVDVSRHMNRILSFDPLNETVTTEPGVVLDQLNAFLGEQGFFFPPTVSTSSRATLGGMFATDAAGKGSRRYGRTSDYVVQADVVLDDGTQVTVSTNDDHAVESPRLNQLCSLIRDELVPLQSEIARIFPNMNRGLTGYNLLDAMPQSGVLNLVKLLAGSEGTLAITSEMKLKVMKKPPCRALTVIAYNDCLEALSHVPALLPANPVAIEFLDDRTIELASQTPMWTQLQAFFGGLEDAHGFLFVEFTGLDEATVDAEQIALKEILAVNNGSNTGVVATREPAQIDALWEMRKLSVGLLAAAQGRRIGVPFVEDAAVPPENLVEFVRDFRTMLNGHNLRYGMFGHADVGCIHVRPMLDMRDQSDRDLIRVVSDAVAELALRYDGLIWGEHSKGVRGEYLRQYVGDELYNVMSRIKATFDPENLFNPGKLVAPDGAEESILKIDTVPFRGERDAKIDEMRFVAFAKSVACNGNGACYNWAPTDPMCPSYKVTRDRVQGPKGRATLLREWTIGQSENRDVREVREIEEALFESLETCLSCKSCTGQCPVQIDIPDMKSAFLAAYFASHARLPRDRIVRRMESISLLGRRMPSLANALLCNAASRALVRILFKIHNIPRFSKHTAEEILQSRNIQMVGLGGEQPVAGSLADNSVCLVLDSFVGPYETGIIAAYADVIAALGYTVIATPVLRNGKALQVRGFEKPFEIVRQKTVERLNKVASLGAPMISLEPAVTDLLAHEYSGDDPSPNYSVQSLDQFLFARLDQLNACKDTSGGPSYSLFLHCTEKTADPATGNRWQAIFAALGIDVDVVSTGCCGMAGLFGHEVEHFDMSKQLFDMSWKEPMSHTLDHALVTGFSCRSQTKRLLGEKPRHPAELMRDKICKNQSR